MFLSLWHLTRAIPIVERYIGCKIRFWHIATAIITSTALCSVLDSPANALFLSGLEEFMQELAEGASSAGGEAIDAEVIELIFNLIRGAFLLLVAAASLFAYNQAQQGNDWRPIVTQVALAFAIVIAIDVITFLFVGNGGGEVELREEGEKGREGEGEKFENFNNPIKTRGLQHLTYTLIPPQVGE